MTHHRRSAAAGTVLRCPAAGKGGVAAGGPGRSKAGRREDPPRPPRFRSGSALRQGALLCLFADDIVARQAAA